MLHEVVMSYNRWHLRVIVGVVGGQNVTQRPLLRESGGLDWVFSCLSLMYEMLAYSVEDGSVKEGIPTK